MSTVLLTVREFITLQDDAFDEALLIHINVAFFALYQLGVVLTTTDEPFVVTSTTTWESLNLAPSIINVVKSNICLRVKVSFDGDKHTVLMQEMILESDHRLLAELYRREDAAAPTEPAP